MFVKVLPNEFKDNTNAIRSKKLILGEDHNATDELLKKLKLLIYSLRNPFDILICVMNLIINISTGLILNIYVLWFNYFGAFSVLLI